MKRENDAQTPSEVALITSSDVADMFNVASSTVRSWIKNGVLKPAFTTPGGQYRFDRATVTALRESLSARGGEG